MQKARAEPKFCQRVQVLGCVYALNSTHFRCHVASKIPFSGAYSERVLRGASQVLRQTESGSNCGIEEGTSEVRCCTAFCDS